MLEVITIPVIIPQKKKNLRYYRINKKERIKLINIKQAYIFLVFLKWFIVEDNYKEKRRYLKQLLPLD